MSQRYFRERSLEAVLSLTKQPRHTLLEVTADWTPLLQRIRMNPTRGARCTRTAYIEQRELPRGTRKHPPSALARLCHGQARLRKLRARHSTGRRVCVH